MDIEKQIHWDSMYTSKGSSNVSWYQSEPKTSLRLIDEYAPPSPNIIDVGGGASTLVDFLLSTGYEHLTIFDISEIALEAAKTRLGPTDKALKVKWVVGDITQFRDGFSSVFNVWHDRAVFHFLTDDDSRKRYVSALHQNTDIGSIVIMGTFAIGGPTTCSKLNIEQYDADKMSLVLGPHFELLHQEEEEHVTPSGSVQLFWYGVYRKIEYF